LIPLYKLDKLPRIQKLRKISKIFTMAEKRLFMAHEDDCQKVFTTSEFVFFDEAARMLAKDDLFSQNAKEVFLEAAEVFGAGFCRGSLFLRYLNGIKHILLAETGRDQADWDFTGSDGKLDLQKRQVFKGMYVYMEDIRSPFNVGAMFRTAESFGVEKIFLSPFCADPKHRRAERTAMGCIDIIPWERCDIIPGSDLSIPIFALETGGLPIAEFPFPQRGLLIAGSEELGVSPQALDAADASLGRVSIPCYGSKASLNVSVAFGIALQIWAKSLAEK